MPSEGRYRSVRHQQKGNLQTGAEQRETDFKGGGGLGGGHANAAGKILLLRLREEMKSPGVTVVKTEEFLPQPQASGPSQGNLLFAETDT